ncbi:3-hydroxyacyl-ACP dehydratase FabZ [Paenibacillus donghaensis]|uniref:3-hydroxyacyl-[acyl-carrier-protein] dehydratase n=1 Tax=Paenibacillus donghaensis TaxID=414771 RepID=A0A2Z2KBD1_9BACL|nr:3-hydroxyacyl-ACP dehydratase FabZ [Paenibacillus donghaensis]ASA20193.1 hypothetical protein B9T62_04890 [Paenibacillus donghaensis]
MDKQRILKFLPHRDPFLFVDDILEIQHKQKVIGIRQVKADEPWAAGHFPGDPVFPGVLLIETMAQIGSFVFYNELSAAHGLDSYLAQVEKVKFVRKVRPGQTLTCEGRFISEFGNFARVSCCAKVADETVSEAVITYYFSVEGGQQ